MFKQYFKTTFRNLWNNKTYSFLNILGLAVGIAVAAMIFLWVEDEMSFNHYFPNYDNLYGVKDQQTYDGTTFTFDATPGPMAPAMKSDIPGIKSTARSTWELQQLFSVNDKAIYDNGHYVDSSFLTMFHLRFIKGNASHAFDQLYSLVITETMAKKLFASTDVTGKRVKVNNEKEYTVTGVIRDLPRNVSFYFKWLAPFRIFENNNPWLKDWGSNALLTFVETEPQANISAINKKLYSYVSTKTTDAAAKMSIYPMNRWRLYNEFNTDGSEKEGRIKYVHLFSLIAWIILTIACINFMNLSTARSQQRAKEVGVRKVMGAPKSRLIVQFLGESLSMAVLSSLVGLIIIYSLLPAFNNLMGKKLSLNLFDPLHFAGLAIITLLCGLTAGSYPAFFLSSFIPVRVLKGLKGTSDGSSGYIRKGLVIIQFSVSVILIISTIVIYQQIQFVKNRDLGYNKDGLVYTSLRGNMKQHFNVIKNDLLKTGLVQNAALSNNPILDLGSSTGDFTWEGKNPNKQALITIEGVSPEYISTMGMQIKNGRDFYSNIKTDSNHIIINESLSNLIHRKNILGSIISRDSGRKQYTIIGVVKDFIYNSMYAPASPLILFSDTSSCNLITLRLNSSSDLHKAVTRVEKTITAENPGYPLEFYFLDEQFNRVFSIESLIGTLAGVFAGLAILISCLGLFGLASYTAERRTKEIGIRKVLGATVSGLTGLLSKDFIKLVLISSFVAFPIAGWMMHDWLQGFQYHIGISWWIFLAAGCLALLIAMLTVTFQAVKAALANPVKCLRTE